MVDLVRLDDMADLPRNDDGRDYLVHADEIADILGVTGAGSLAVLIYGYGLA